MCGISSPALGESCAGGPVIQNLEINTVLELRPALHEESGNSAFYVCGTFSAYLCVLCVKYIGANDLTQSTQRYTEIRRETMTANEPTFRAKQLRP